MSIIYCPVCGKNIRFSNTCPGCGYAEKNDYEAYPTFSKIKNGIKSVECKRQEYENNRFESQFSRYAHTLISDMAEQNKVVMVLKSEVDDLKKQNEILKTRLENTELQLKQNVIHTEVIKQQKNPEIGETIYFGSYWQDAKGKEKKPIEWIILDKGENKLLLISKYALDCKPYNDKNEGTTWEKCSLRTWLNSGFVADAFRSQELGRIVETKVTAVKNLKYKTNPGNDTNDKVFLLSIKEAEKYFSRNEARQCKPTEYAIENNALVNNKGNCWWWLRSPGHRANEAAAVLRVGSVYYHGLSVSIDFSAVRPALWIEY